MARAFNACHDALGPDGRLVIVFAHKQPNAWEKLVGAIFQAGFEVEGSWPIQTEQAARLRAQNSASLASSVWLVCRKRDAGARAGWDTHVVKEMESNIVQRLRDFWDAGIRGPDFVWAATGPALEAYSRYPAVRKAAETGEVMGVEEFLRHVRRIVVDFVVGRVLSGAESDTSAAEQPLDDITTYYLLHRNDFQLGDAPAGPCILYMVSCALTQRDLADPHGILVQGGRRVRREGGDSEEGSGGGPSLGSGLFRLKPWSRRKHKNLGEDGQDGRSAPLIDQVHRLMHLWKAGNLIKVDAYLDRKGLRRNPLFGQLVQALIEQSRDEGRQGERSMLERIANHLGTGTGTAQRQLAV